MELSRIVKVIYKPFTGCGKLKEIEVQTLESCIDKAEIKAREFLKEKTEFHASYRPIFSIVYVI